MINNPIPSQNNGSMHEYIIIRQDFRKVPTPSGISMALVPCLFLRDLRSQISSGINPSSNNHQGSWSMKLLNSFISICFYLTCCVLLESRYGFDHKFSYPFDRSCMNIHTWVRLSKFDQVGDRKQLFCIC